MGEHVGPRVAPVVVIGAGASGLLSARALVRAGHPRVVLIERDTTWSAGPAYATTDPLHLLNVAAGKLGIDADQPQGFVDWAREHGEAATGDSFLSRSLFGRYLRESLDTAARGARSSTLTKITGEVTSLGRCCGRHDATQVRVGLANGRSIVAAHVVLALGNPPSRGIDCDSDGVLGDPWSACRPGRIRPDESVVIVGAGLSAVDVAITLTARGHRGPIRMLSRHGRLPCAHDGRPVRPIALPEPPVPLTARSIVGWIRGAIDDAGDDWRAVVDALRFQTNEIWAGLSEGERARLVRHAMRRWEVHRHRIAPEIAARVDALLATGRLDLSVGIVTGVERGRGALHRVKVCDARGERSSIDANWVINCTGPNFDLRDTSSPLIGNLFDSGLARPGSLGLGLDVDAAGALIDGSGRPAPAITVVGPLRRGALWETTAIPEIRAQADALRSRVSAAPVATHAHDGIHASLRNLVRRAARDGRRLPTGRTRPRAGSGRRS